MKTATQSLTTQNLLFEGEDVKKPEDEKEARMRRAPILNQIEMLNEETFREVHLFDSAETESKEAALLRLPPHRNRT